MSVATMSSQADVRSHNYLQSTHCVIYVIYDLCKHLHYLHPIQQSQYINCIQLAANIPRLSTYTLRKRSFRMAGHCGQHPELPVSNLVLWESMHWETVRGGQSLIYIDQIRRTLVSVRSTAEIITCMEDRDV